MSSKQFVNIDSGSGVAPAIARTSDDPVPGHTYGAPGLSVLT